MPSLVRGHGKILSLLPQYSASCLPNISTKERNIECSRDEFVSLIDPWRGKRCVVTVASETLECRLLLQLDTLSTGCELHFTGAFTSDKFKLDLSTADFFAFGDALIAPEPMRGNFDLAIESVVLARITGQMLVGIALMRA